MLIVFVRIGIRMLLSQKRELDTSMLTWTPPRQYVPPPQQVAPAPQPAQQHGRLATFAPPPAAPSGGYAPAPIKQDLPPPVDLNDVFNRPRG
jgi:hypothetical protein